MADSRKHKLSIYRANFFMPKIYAVEDLALSPDERSLAAIKRSQSDAKLKHCPNQIHVYSISSSKIPRHDYTFVGNEKVTAITWISDTCILATSTDQTITIYDITTCRPTTSIITDYGSIMCVDYNISHNLLITGTEYGYVAAYRIAADAIEFVGKMVKTSEHLDSICMHLKEKRKKINPTTERKEKPINNKPVKIAAGKRKRSDSSDESEDDDDLIESEYLDDVTITIYGSSKNRVVVWDYHRKTIMDTIQIGQESCRVHCIAILKTGELLVGDSTGSVSIYDPLTLTRKQCLKVLDAPILDMALSKKHDLIFATGQDAMVVVIKRDKSGSDFILFEKSKVNNHFVNCLVKTMKKSHYTGSADGRITKFNVQSGGKEGQQTKHLVKTEILPELNSRVKFSCNEMMFQFESYMDFYGLQKVNLTAKSNSDIGQPMPPKTLTLKARTYIYSATFSDKWICYSTKKKLCLFKRDSDDLRPYGLVDQIGESNLLELCADNRYLAVATQTNLRIIDLRESSAQDCDIADGEKLCPNLVNYDFDCCIRHLFYFKTLDKLIVATCQPSNSMYIYELDETSKEYLNISHQFSLGSHKICFLAYNTVIKRDHTLYAYTTQDKLLKLDVENKLDNDTLIEQADARTAIQGLPDRTNILGIVFITREQAILYDNYRLIKLCLYSDKVTNISTDYEYIIHINNRLFDKSEHLALVELVPADYSQSVPISKTAKKRFGGQ